MEYEFHVRDPTTPDTVYLFEAIIGALPEATSCAGIFAFASRAGVDALFGQPEMRSFLTRSTMSLLIEIASHRGEPYPEAGPPIAVYRELHARSFAYMLLMPDDPGYDAMFELTETLPPVGRGLPRVITDSDNIRSAWPSSPLITAIDRTR